MDPIKIEPFRIYKLPILSPYITITFLFPNTRITPPLTLHVENLATNTLIGWCSSSIMESHECFLTNPSCIWILIDPIPINLQGLPRHSHHSFLTLHVKTLTSDAIIEIRFFFSFGIWRKFNNALSSSLCIWIPTNFHELSLSIRILLLTI